MKRTRIYLWAGCIAFLLLALMAIQFVWLRDATAAAHNETRVHVQRALERTEQQLRNTNYCFEMYGKVYINPGESFYIARQEGKDGTSIDTVQLFYDTEGYYPDTVLYRERTLKEGLPLTADIHLSFHATVSDTDAYYNERRAYYERLTGKRLRDIITDGRPVSSLFNMKLVDSFLRTALREEQVPDSFGFGFIDKKAGKVAYAARVQDSAALLASPYTTLLFTENKFLKPYTLALVFPGPPAVHVFNFWLLLALAVVGILGFVFYAFVRLYLRQTRLSEMKSDFINNLTHEFNTPMANISLAIETIEDSGQQPPRLKRVMGIIASESVRLRENIERALQVATLEKGNLQLKMEEVNLVQMIHTVMATYQLQCEQLGGHMTFFHPAKVIVRGDETHLLNCVCNLLDNAIKYRNGAPLVELFLEEKNGHALLTVADNGQGMTAETQKHIFEKFYRAHQGDVHNTKGFGLGLSYVRGIVEVHGGRITVQSRKGAGTKFIIQLPKTV